MALTLSYVNTPPESLSLLGSDVDSGAKICILARISMGTLINLAACQFAPLTDLGPLRGRLLALCKSWHLRGLIAISSEGIDLLVTGQPESINALLNELRLLPSLQNLTPRSTPSQHQPFAGMRVSVQKSLLEALDITSVSGTQRTVPTIPAHDLKRWLDQECPVVLCDLRDHSETLAGGFRRAHSVGTTSGNSLPEALRQLPSGFKDQVLVLVCRNGNRCEQAAPLLQYLGFQRIFRLQGGLSAYRQACGESHLHGHFLELINDDSEHQHETLPCLVCGLPLETGHQTDPRYVPGKSCQHCFKTEAQEMTASIAQRHERIRIAVSPLPGSQPRDSYKSITVRPECDGKSVLDALRFAVEHLPDSHWQRECAEDRILNLRHEPVGTSEPVRAGQIYLHKFPNATEPEVNGDVRILHEDEALIVINKPAPLPMHAGGRFFRNTLQHILNAAYEPEKPRPAHRLDANTTGVLLVTRSQLFAGRLQPQFSQGRIKKQYLVRVHGHPPDDNFHCDAPISPESRELGSRGVDFERGLSARTEFRVLRRDADATALLEANPLTGRTNQIRVHLWHLGFPICGDPVYLAQGGLGHTQTLHREAPPLNLHSWRITFEHPLDRRPTEFTAPAPEWATNES